VLRLRYGNSALHQPRQVQLNRLAHVSSSFLDRAAIAETAGQRWAPSVKAFVLLFLLNDDLKSVELHLHFLSHESVTGSQVQQRKPAGSPHNTTTPLRTEPTIFPARDAV